MLKGLINTTGLGVKPKTLKDVLESEKTAPKKRGRKKKGEGIGALAGIAAKAAAKALAPIAIDAASNFAKDKVSGLGVRGRPRKKKGGN